MVRVLPRPPIWGLIVSVLNAVTVVKVFLRYSVRFFPFYLFLNWLTKNSTGGPAAPLPELTAFPPWLIQIGNRGHGIFEIFSPFLPFLFILKLVDEKFYRRSCCASPRTYSLPTMVNSRSEEHTS